VSLSVAKDTSRWLVSTVTVNSVSQVSNKMQIDSLVYTLVVDEMVEIFIVSQLFLKNLCCEVQ
jgi:hypothetical protein